MPLAAIESTCRSNPDPREDLESRSPKGVPIKYLIVV